jgi:hypothetical protein
MPRRLPANVWKRNSLIGDLITGLPFAGFLLAGAFYSRLFFAVALLFFAVGFTLQRIRIRRTKCQKCCRLLQRNPKDDSPISFHCAACDIIWETGSIQDG